jgi:hypothetical protein
MIRLLATAPERDGRIQCVGLLHFRQAFLSQRLPSRALITLSTGLPETAIVTAPVVRLRSRAREQQDRSSSRFCVRFRWIRRAWNETFS